MFDIITVGSATVDVFVDTGGKLTRGDFIEVPIGSKNLVRNIHFDTGGGATNTGCALARLGFKVAVLTKIGNDHNAGMITEALDDFGCDTSLVVVGDGPSDYSIILDARGRDRTVLTIKRMNDRLRFDELDLSRLKTRWFYFCTMLGESLKTQARLVNHALENGIRIAYNCSSYIIERRPPEFFEILRNTEVLVLNREEAELLTHREGISAMADRILEFGPSVVAITDGAKGAYGFSKDRGLFIRSHRIEVVENTGAGDAFGAAFVAGYILGKDLRTCLEIGATEAESVIQHLGAKNRLLSKEEIERQVEQNPHKIDPLRWPGGK